MNYIYQIRGFYDLQLANPFSTGQIALWHALMHINNKCGWKEWFTVASRTLELHTGLSRQGIIKARNVLKQRGLLLFRTNGSKATAYCLMPLYPVESVQPKIQPCIQGERQESGLFLNKNKTKQKKEDLISSESEKGVPHGPTNTTSQSHSSRSKSSSTGPVGTTLGLLL